MQMVTDEKVRQLENELKERDELIKKLKLRNLQIISYVKSIKKLEKNQVFFLMTTPSSARQNRFEFGGFDDENSIKKLICSYNKTRAADDLYYCTKIIYCNDYRSIETRVKSVLTQFINRAVGRNIHMRYDCLEAAIDFICENYDREIEFLNSRCDEYFNNTLADEPIIPDPIDLQTLPASTEASVQKADRMSIRADDIRLE